MNKLIYKDWDENLPRLITFSRPTASARNLHLSGSGTARMSRESYIKDLDFINATSTENKFKIIMQ